MNEQGLYDIYGIWHVPFWQTKVWFSALGLAGIICCAVLIWYGIKKNCANKKQLPVWEMALQELQQMQAKRVVTAEHCKEFYCSLMLIIKKYLHGRYGYDTHGKTDDELLIYLEQQHFPVDLLDELRAIVAGGVVVKFANAQVIQAQVEQDFSKTIALIKRTVPQE